jgi:hypothetical protein
MAAGPAANLDAELAGGTPAPLAGAKKNRGSGSQREATAQRERHPATTPKVAVEVSTTKIKLPDL